MLPGFVLAILGTLITAISIAQVDIFGREWEINTTTAGSLLMIVGTQVLALGLCAHAYGTYFMGEKDAWFDRMRALPPRARARPGRRDPARRPRNRRRHRRHLDRERDGRAF